MPKCVENADCSLCVFLLLFRRSIIISSLTTVKSVTCSFSFTHRIHSPTTVYRFTSDSLYCLSVCLWLCEWVSVGFFFQLTLLFPTISLCLLSIWMKSNVKITAKWLFHSIEILTTASMATERRKKTVFILINTFVRLFFSVWKKQTQTHSLLCARESVLNVLAKN